jgi:hypothetical protein
MNNYKSIGKLKKGQIDPLMDTFMNKYPDLKIACKRRDFIDGNEWFFQEETANLFLEMFKDRPFANVSIEDLEYVIKQQDNVIATMKENCDKNHIKPKITPCEWNSKYELGCMSNEQLVMACPHNKDKSPFQ